MLLCIEAPLAYCLPSRLVQACGELYLGRASILVDELGARVAEPRAVPLEVLTTVRSSEKE